MENVTLLWVDARLNKVTETYFNQLNTPKLKHLCKNIAQALSMMNAVSPDIVVFDFDYADILGLRALKQIREKFPHIPIIMMTEQHYESLSIWALRCRVWDYFPKPINTQIFTQQLNSLMNCVRENKSEYKWLKTLPSNKIPYEASISGKSKSDLGTSIAINYIEAHLHEKISADDVSKQCGLTRYELSRAFKLEYSLTFRDFLLKLRMERAEKMLLHTQASITEICLSVGFNDLSHFTRKFHQFYGKSPSAYRQVNKKYSYGK